MTASVVSAKELPPIPEGSGLGVASTSMVFAIVCDMRHRRPQMVVDAKNLFLKFARKDLKDPEVATERAFKEARRGVTPSHATAANQHTVESCDRLARMLKRELSR
ncbi:hypothetical protein KX729_14960 [Rhizobium sp. XQZ8]|uniref:hypothetical protein n=1 Tax=Rhizobium populisoli TaxID=2859785 RepID=UPI001CA5250D|nr:hypothetical protein [Rhizobium populisoli]MBW6422755.1 hypothetical protein [Rhizobium populisoli]